MCRSVRGGTLAASRPHVGGVMRCAGVYGRLLGGARQAPLLLGAARNHPSGKAAAPAARSMQVLVRWLHGGGLLGVAAFLLDWCRQPRSSRRQAAWVPGASLS